MKKLIAILCTLCMIATMVPFSVMAENAATMTVYKSWDGSVVPPDTTNHGFTTTAATVLEPAVVTDNLGGNSGPYMQFTAASAATDANEILVHSNGSLKYDAPYAAISINVYGKALQDMYARYGSNVKPAITGNISGCLVEDRWNNVFVAWDGAAKEATLYVNGTEIRTQNFYDFVENLGTASETDTVESTVDREANTWTWTNGTKSEKGSFSSTLNDVRMRFVKNPTTDLTYYIDDIYVMTSEAEMTPAAYTTVTSNDAVISGNSIVTKVNANSAALSAAGAKIMVKHDDVWSEKSVVTAGDEVVVITSTPYGDVYSEPYTVTADTYDKFWDGSSTAALSSNIGWTESYLTAEFKADGLGGKVNDTYVTYTGSASESVIYGKNSYSTRYFAMSINAYGKSIRDMFPRLASSYKPSLVAKAKFGGNLTRHLVDNIWNNVFFVFDSQTKDMKTYVNGELKATVNLYDTIESSIYNGTVNRTAGTAKIGTTNINANLMNLKTDLRIVLNNGSASYIDDLAFMYTDYEPTPAAYVTTVTSDNAEQIGNFIVLNDGVETATVAASGATVVVNDGTAWSQTNTVKEGDKILLVTATPYGNIYATTYLSVIQTCEGTLKDTDGVEGAFKWVVDPNAGSLTISKVDGVGNGEIAAFEDHLPNSEAEKIAPWYNITLESLITDVVVGEGITSLPAQILRQNGAYAKVTLPSTLSSTASFVFNAAKVSELYIKEGAAFTGGSMINGNCTVNKIIFPSTMTPDKSFIRDLSFGTYGGFANKTLEVVAPYNSPAYLWAQERYAEAVAAKEETKGEETKYWGIQAAKFTVTESYKITACENGVVTIANNTGYPIDSAYVIIGYYDGEGDLIAAKLSGKQTLAEATNTVTLDTVAGAASTKVFVWNNMTDLKPLANIYE